MPLTYNLFTPQVSVSYAPDVFGLTRRTVESFKAQEEEARFQLAAAYTTLVNNVVVDGSQCRRSPGPDRRHASS